MSGFACANASSVILLAGGWLLLLGTELGVPTLGCGER